ncbi:hypothetical protein BU17DRAFT_54650 [Hysterangium stoloniferum]|nr:hypothetical protein BU17DRAFT_54650 [Hysterangium stoloniferum]
MQSQPLHSKTVWIDDGDIILSGENMLFRVKRSQLELHSTWWKDSDLYVAMFTTGWLDGCRVMTLVETAIDLEHWLAALHDIQKTPRMIDTLDDFRRAASIAWMSFKYQSEAFLHQALACVQSRWPSSLEGWQTFISECETSDGGLPGPYLAVHPARVIWLAQLTDQDLLLPAAYHLLIQMVEQDAAPPEDLIAIDIWIPFHKRLMKNYGNLLKYYDGERWDITRAFVTTIEACTSTQRNVYDGSPESCIDRLKQPYRLYGVEHSRIRDFLAQRIYNDSKKLSQIFTYTEDFPAKYGLCQSCTIAVNRQRERNFERLRSNLPSLLGLGTWESMRGVRFSA